MYTSNKDVVMCRIHDYKNAKAFQFFYYIGLFYLKCSHGILLCRNADINSPDAEGADRAIYKMSLKVSF